MARTVNARGRPSGRRRGDSGTRAAIEAAAARQFAEHGYDRASMRSIALEAGVDPALVSHFFGSKQRLFVAVVELPFDPAQAIPVLLEGDPAEVGERLARFLVGVLENEAGRRRAVGLVRAAASEAEAARLVRALVEDQLFAPIAEHLGADNPRLRASFVGAQMVGLVMARYVVAVEPLASLPADALVANLAGLLQKLLTGPIEG
jgi:AcrR family transcriptional regulator